MNIKSKKKVTYFLENQSSRASLGMNKNQNTSNSQSVSVSVSKNFRQKSVGYESKKKDPQPLMSQQKIQLVKTQKGFLIDKKYLVFEIECFISKSSETQKNISLILDMNFIHINKNQLRHSFEIQKDGKQFLQVKIDEYRIQNITIPNRRIQFIQIDIDYENLTIVKPLQMLQENEDLRRRKIINKEGIKQFSWALNTKREKQKETNHHEKRFSALNNNYFHQIQAQPIKSDRQYFTERNRNSQVHCVSKNKQNSLLNNNFENICDEYYGKRTINIKKKSKMQEQSFDKKTQRSYNFRF